MRNPLTVLTPAYFEGISAARESEIRYARHVAPVITWALAEYGNARDAVDALDRMRHYDDVTDSAFSILDSARSVLNCTR